MSFWGADTTALLGIGADIRESAGQIDEVLSAAVSRLESTAWVGPDREIAVTSAHRLLDEARSVENRLHRTADEIDSHVEEQNSASDPDGDVAGNLSRWSEFFSLPPLVGAEDLDLGSTAQDFLTFGDDDFDPLDWVLGTAEEAAGWTWDNIGVPVVNGIASFGQAMIDNPLATGTMILGLGIMAVGAAGEGVGIALLPTGLVTAGGGTAAGGVVMVGSAEIIAAGAAITAAGGGVLLAESANNPQSPASPRQPEAYQPSSGSGGAPRPAGEVLGEMPAGRSPGVRTVGSDAELQASYDQMARGGEIIRRPGYRGEWVRQPDGTEIGLRETSSSGGRTIDVRHPDGTTEKVHIR